ncbi:hypothetical protein HPP92_002917 [Vanilla planifolia]|uniref:Cyclin N-terminal domain-containing protein n=1 Tax=Vanilla planifolia TaxID=51239 RepID=A0A835S180_VANPL|nr:hypothetical protein HPP92_002917 [Vanilla planifolia]
MSSVSRRSSFSSSVSSSALVKRPAMENVGKVSVSAPEQAKKRVALGNLTNVCNVGRSAPRMSVTKGSNVVVTASSTSKVKKGSSVNGGSLCLQRKPTKVSSLAKPVTSVSKVDSTITSDGPISIIASRLIPGDNAKSPCSSGGSISIDETMSTCDSLKSPEFEYIDHGDSSMVASLERQATHNLHISDDMDSTVSLSEKQAHNLQFSDHLDTKGNLWKVGIPSSLGELYSITNVDDNQQDPQLCASLAGDVYEHLRLAEMKKRPTTNFMEITQKDINASMRAILIDWLVEVAEEYRLAPDTLYLTVNYIDRYLSGNDINRQRLQLLGVACMFIAAKYEEICAPQVEEFCYITDNTYFKDEVLQMEAAVLKFLKFEMTAPTAKCFLRRFVRVAQHSDEVPLLHLEFLANYVAELSLPEYSMLCYSPSQISAASVFVAKFILHPSKRPWNATLAHYTQYKASELQDCTKALHLLCCNSSRSTLPAIRDKYSQHKYKFVAKKTCPPTIPAEFFED